jgi:hypothetical protein
MNLPKAKPSPRERRNHAERTQRVNGRRGRGA